MWRRVIPGPMVGGLPLHGWQMDRHARTPRGEHDAATNREVFESKGAGLGSRLDGGPRMPAAKDLRADSRAHHSARAHDA
jgi:hypothetical protein